MAAVADHTETRGLLLSHADVVRYVRGGHGRFTLVSTSTGTRFTFRASTPREVREGRPTPIFLSLLRGPDNSADYTFLGTLWPDGYRHGARSRVTKDAPSARGLDWFMRTCLFGNDIPAGLEVWHEGSCCRCGRALTDPESIARGVGPVCAGKNEG